MELTTAPVRVLRVSVQELPGGVLRVGHAGFQDLYVAAAADARVNGHAATAREISVAMVVHGASPVDAPEGQRGALA